MVGWDTPDHKAEELRLSAKKSKEGLSNLVYLTYFCIRPFEGQLFIYSIHLRMFIFVNSNEPLSMRVLLSLRNTFKEIKAN